MRFVIYNEAGGTGLIGAGRGCGSRELLKVELLFKFS